MKRGVGGRKLCDRAPDRRAHPASVRRRTVPYARWTDRTLSACRNHDSE